MPNGRLDQEGLTAGTSAASALATRAAHRLFEALMEVENGAVLTDVPSDYYGVVVKALLAHRAQWGCKGSPARSALAVPTARGNTFPARTTSRRVLGYGRPLVEEAMTCERTGRPWWATEQSPPDGSAALYRVPLPASLERVTEPRSITTLAWFSPVNVRHRAYRRVKLELKPLDPTASAGVSRVREQPSDKSVPRGSLFHVRYHGDKAVAFVDDGHLQFRVFCREQGGALDQPIRYGLAVTIEAGEGVPVYQEVRQRLGIQPQVTANAP